jgi:DNA-binding transcriptional regulator YiaG
MDRKIQKIASMPNYQSIYKDMIEQKFPDKLDDCKKIIEKASLCALDVILLNKIIFGEKVQETERFNQRHRSYDEKSIIKILDYQKKHELNNIQLARVYKLSRNTIAKWKKQYA